MIEDFYTNKSKFTIYLKSAGNEVNIYLMPYWMKRYQRPGDLDQKYKDKWKLVGKLNSRLQVVFLESVVQEYKLELEGQCPETFFEVYLEDSLL